MNKKILAFVTNGKEFLALRNNPSEPDKYGGDFWFVVTGGVEKGENFEDAVKREVNEETGLKVKKLISLNWGCMYKDRAGENEEHYYLAFVSTKRVILSIEHINYEWLPLPGFLDRISWDGNKLELKRVLGEALNSNSAFFSWIILDDFINHKRIIYVQGKKYILTWHLVDDFSKIPKNRVNGIYCVPFDKNGRILIVDVKENNGWAIPGGGVENGESYFETLRRECMEEADMEIYDMKPLGYNETVEIDENGKENVIYRLRYFARIAKLNKQTTDPATGFIAFRKLIKPEDFAFYCPWGFQGDEMIKKAVKMFKQG